MHFGRGPGHDDVLALAGDAVHDGGDLLGRFALAEHRLGKAAAEGPMVVDLGKAQILVGQGAELVGGLIGRNPTRLDGLEQLPEGLGVH